MPKAKWGRFPLAEMTFLLWYFAKYISLLNLLALARLFSIKSSIQFFIGVSILSLSLHLETGFYAPFPSFMSVYYTKTVQEELATSPPNPRNQDVCDLCIAPTNPHFQETETLSTLESEQDTVGKTRAFVSVTKLGFSIEITRRVNEAH